MTKPNSFLCLLAALALIATPVLCTPANGAVGDIFETNEGNVLRFGPSGGTPTNFATGLSSPKDIVFDGRGRMYVADAANNLVVVYTVPDGSAAVYAADFSSPIGLAFDANGSLYVSEATTGKIIKITIDGTRTTFAANAGTPAGMAFDASGNLFVADFDGGAVYKFDSAGTRTTFASGLSFPADVAIDTAGNIFVSDSESGSILKFTPDGTRTTFASNLSRPYGIAFDASGNLLVADNEEGATLRYAPDGKQTVLFESNFNTPQFLAVEPASHQLLNVSTRGLVQTGDNVLIAGFVVGGTGPVGTSVLVRALGPSLAQFGLANALADPVLELRNASGVLIGSNDNWKDSQQAAITATGLAPTNDLESAILTVLNGGSFTAIVRGANGSTGTAVVEVYHLQ
ncbi:MAG TPA: NHL repeat-containing protein [Chthoniobacterales bacterium]|jgi:sugar lactone lactonase YvrE|nr:NHL repeat-containing protein [Chthoniobacterales bacterium]